MDIFFSYAIEINVFSIFFVKSAYNGIIFVSSKSF